VVRSSSISAGTRLDWDLRRYDSTRWIQGDRTRLDWDWRSWDSTQDWRSWDSTRDSRSLDSTRLVPGVGTRLAWRKELELDLLGARSVGRESVKVSRVLSNFY